MPAGVWGICTTLRRLQVSDLSTRGLSVCNDALCASAPKLIFRRVRTDGKALVGSCTYCSKPADSRLYSITDKTKAAGRDWSQHVGAHLCSACYIRYSRTGALKDHSGAGPSKRRQTVCGNASCAKSLLLESHVHTITASNRSVGAVDWSALVGYTICNACYQLYRSAGSFVNRKRRRSVSSEDDPDEDGDVGEHDEDDSVDDNCHESEPGDTHRGMSLDADGMYFLRNNRPSLLLHNKDGEHASTDDESGEELEQDAIGHSVALETRPDFAGVGGFPACTAS